MKYQTTIETVLPATRQARWQVLGVKTQNSLFPDVELMFLGVELTFIVEELTFHVEDLTLAPVINTLSFHLSTTFPVPLP